VFVRQIGLPVFEESNMYVIKLNLCQLRPGAPEPYADTAKTPVFEPKLVANVETIAPLININTIKKPRPMSFRVLAQLPLFLFKSIIQGVRYYLGKSE
jgi:hypothetical protein